MKERAPDDTPKPDPSPPGEREREPGDYYYDDATGYEIYQPDDEDGAGDDVAGAKQLTTEGTEEH